jgi:hypothetical protein
MAGALRFDELFSKAKLDPAFPSEMNRQHPRAISHG